MTTENIYCHIFYAKLSPNFLADVGQAVPFLFTGSKGKSTELLMGSEQMAEPIPCLLPSRKGIRRRLQETQALLSLLLRTHEALNLRLITVAREKGKFQHSH